MDILALGGLNLDILGQSEGPIGPGDSNPGSVGVRAGGVCHNIAAELAGMGHRVSLLSCLGRDRFSALRREICAAEEARLRLLLLTTGNIPGAAEKIAGMDPNLQLFWERECRGLGRFIETQEAAEGNGGEKTAWMETLPDFQEGVRALKTGMPLAVRKSLFVKEPSVFGYYEEVPASFAPGEVVNAYFELDNVVCEPSGEKNGCDIAVLCRRELVDSLNRNVVETKEKLCQGHSASPLNDIVLNLSVTLPKRIPAGTYTLRTVFLDRHSALSQPVTHTMEIRVD